MYVMRFPQGKLFIFHIKDLEKKIKTLLLSKNVVNVKKKYRNISEKYKNIFTEAIISSISSLVITPSPFKSYKSNVHL